MNAAIMAEQALTGSVAGMCSIEEYLGANAEAHYSLPANVAPGAVNGD